MRGGGAGDTGGFSSRPSSSKLRCNLQLIVQGGLGSEMWLLDMGGLEAARLALRALWVSQSLGYLSKSVSGILVCCLGGSPVGD